MFTMLKDQTNGMNADHVANVAPNYGLCGVDAFFLASNRLPSR